MGLLLDHAPNAAAVDRDAAADTAAVGMVGGVAAVDDMAWAVVVEVVVVFCDIILLLLLLLRFKVDKYCVACCLRSLGAGHDSTKAGIPLQKLSSPYP